MVHYIDESKGARQQKDGKHMNNGHIWTVTYIEQKWKLERERERHYCAPTFTYTKPFYYASLKLQRRFVCNMVVEGIIKSMGEFL